MTNAVADFEVDADLDGGDLGERYLATAPARLGPGRRTVVVQALPWADEAAWARLRPVLDAVHAVSVAQDHLADLVEAGFSPGTGAWYVAAYPGRASLADGGLEPDVVLRAVAAAAEALHDLHEAGVVHTAVAPSTISPDGELALPPIGQNRLDDGRLLTVRSTAALDTVDPAWARGGWPSRETDLYALGATLHAAATGRLLHPDLVSDPAVVALQRVMFEPVELARDMDPDVAATVAACVATDPANRPPSALALAGHLRTLVGRS